MEHTKPSPSPATATLSVLSSDARKDFKIAETIRPTGIKNPADSKAIAFRLAHYQKATTALTADVVLKENTPIDLLEIGWKSHAVLADYYEGNVSSTTASDPKPKDAKEKRLDIVIELETGLTSAKKPLTSKEKLQAYQSIIHQAEEALTSHPNTIELYKILHLAHQNLAFYFCRRLLVSKKQPDLGSYPYLSMLRKDDLALFGENGDSVTVVLEFDKRSPDVFLEKFRLLSPAKQYYFLTSPQGRSIYDQCFASPTLTEDEQYRADELAKLLRDLSADYVMSLVNQDIYNGLTPLFYAATKGFDLRVSVMLQKQDNLQKILLLNTQMPVTAGADGGTTAVQGAILYNHLKTVKEMLKDIDGSNYLLVILTKRVGGAHSSANQCTFNLAITAQDYSILEYLLTLPTDDQRWELIATTTRLVTNFEVTASDPLLFPANKYLWKALNNKQKCDLEDSIERLLKQTNPPLPAENLKAVQLMRSELIQLKKTQATPSDPSLSSAAPSRGLLEAKTSGASQGAFAPSGYSPSHFQAKRLRITPPQDEPSLSAASASTPETATASSSSSSSSSTSSATAHPASDAESSIPRL